MRQNLQVPEIETRLLVEAILLRYGYDFSQYRFESMQSSFMNHANKHGYPSISDLIPVILKDKPAFNRLFMEISVGTTEMFRTPQWYRRLREHVVPILKTYPFVNIWHAGCATGEEAYSTAILLMEEGLYDRCHIYATDINDYSLRQAKSGFYPLKDMQRYTRNYHDAGCRRSLGDYYHTRYNAAKINENLKRNITFSNHNLVTDGVFSEMHLVVCRNVLIYFNRELQVRVLKLFTDSLCRKGFLALGSHETLDFTPVRGQFEMVEAGTPLYKKKISLNYYD